MAVVDDRYADRVDHALSKATKKMNKVIDSDDYDTIKKALGKASDDVADCVFRIRPYRGCATMCP